MDTSFQREVTGFLQDYGATNIRVVPGGKHPKVTFNFKGVDRSTVIPGTSGDHRALDNQLAQLKRMLGPPVEPELRKARKLADMFPAGQGIKDKAPIHHVTVVNRPGVFMSIPKAELKIDQRYQRPLNTRAIERIAHNWSWPACGVLLVSLRDTQGYYVFDGQHRWEAARLIDRVDELPCLAFEELTLKDEATAFLGANTDRRAMFATQKFNALIVAGDEIAQEVERLAKSIGRTIEHQSSAKTITCVSRVMSCIRMNHAALKRIWPIAAELNEGRVFHERVLKALWSLEVRMPKGQSLELPRWRDKITKAGVEAILMEMRNMIAIEGNAGEKIVARGLLRAMNKGQTQPLRVNLD